MEQHIVGRVLILSACITLCFIIPSRSGSRVCIEATSHTLKLRWIAERDASNHSSALFASNEGLYMFDEERLRSGEYLIPQNLSELRGKWIELRALCASEPL